MLREFHRAILITIVALINMPIVMNAASVPILKSNEIKIAISSVPNNINPFFSVDSNSQNINRLVHASLTDFDRSMSFSCILCERYSETVKDGKHRIHFLLKKDIKFWDGSSVTSHDVKKSVSYFSSKEMKSIFRFAFSNTPWEQTHF